MIRVFALLMNLFYPICYDCAFVCPETGYESGRRDGRPGGYPVDLKMYCKKYFRCDLLSVTLLAVFSVHGQESVPVRVAPLSEIAIYPERTAPATVLSLNDTGIAAEIQAKVEALPVNVGDIVNAGELLVELNCRNYTLALEQAQARLDSLQARVELARHRLKRSRELVTRQFVSEEIVDERKSDLSVLLAEQRAAAVTIKQEQVHVANCRIYSPFRALVTERIGSVGHYADVGRPLVQVLDIDKLEISAQIFVQDAAMLEQVKALGFEHNDKVYPLALRAILPAVNSDTHHQEVRLLFRNDPALVGAAGKLIWREMRPYVPGNLIIRRHGQLGFLSTVMDRQNLLQCPQSRPVVPVRLTCHWTRSW